jgi:hypothetical protein
MFPYHFDLFLEPGFSHYYVVNNPTSVLIEKCVSLAHGLEIDVPDNDYFKSEQCRSDFAAILDERHVVSFTESQWVRDDVTNNIIGIDQTKKYNTQLFF